jgi:hypothetical protein
MQNKNTLSIETEMHIHAALDIRLQDVIDRVRTCDKELDKAITEENKTYWKTSKDFWQERVDGITKAKEEFRRLSDYCFTSIRPAL